MIRQLLALLAFPVCHFGGGSSSANATTTTYNTTDSRIAAGDGTTVVRVSDGMLAAGDAVQVTGSNNSIMTSDPQVVRDAFAYASNRDALAGQTIESVLNTSRELLGKAAASIDTAASTTRGGISERMFAIGAGTLAVLGALAYMRKGH